ncbi:MAG: MFS transporter [Chloroflexi bacterium]|nr:MAG: MFS transporter [Chloroflexota bacterium]
MWQPLRRRGFALLWTSQVVSGFGDRITLIGLAYLSWVVTGSTLVTALAVVVSTVPHAIFGLFAGSFADAYGRRRAMVVCDVGRAIVVAALPAAFWLGLPLGVMYALVFAATSFSAVFNPARLALTPDLLEHDELGRGNALLIASDRVVDVAGSLLAGVLVQAVTVLAFYVDAASFLLSAFLLMQIGMSREPRSTLSAAAIWKDARDGLRVIRNVSALWTNTVFSLIAQLSIPVFNSLMPVLIFKAFGGATEYGIAEGAFALGAVAAGLLLPAAFQSMHKGRLVVLGFAAFGLVLLVIARANDFATLVLLLVIAGVANMLSFIPNVTIAQEITPPTYRARVFGARIALLNLTWLPVIFVSGALGDVIGVTPLIAIAGAVTLVTAIAGAFIPAVRDVP